MSNYCEEHEYYYADVCPACHYKPGNICQKCGENIGQLEYKMVGDRDIHEVSYCPGCGTPIGEALPDVGAGCQGIDSTTSDPWWWDGDARVGDDGDVQKLDTATLSIDTDLDPEDATRIDPEQRTFEWSCTIDISEMGAEDAFALGRLFSVDEDATAECQESDSTTSVEEDYALAWAFLTGVWYGTLVAGMSET